MHPTMNICSVPENNAAEYAIPFCAVPWNNANRYVLFSCSLQLPILLRMNFCAKATNSIANSFAYRTNSFANGTKSTAKRTNSIAKTCKYVGIIWKMMGKRKKRNFRE